jgi:hypothetical protein
MIARSGGAIKVRPDQKIFISRDLENYAKRLETIKDFVMKLLML